MRFVRMTIIVLAVSVILAIAVSPARASSVDAESWYRHWFKIAQHNRGHAYVYAVRTGHLRDARFFRRHIAVDPWVYPGWLSMGRAWRYYARQAYRYLHGGHPALVLYKAPAVPPEGANCGHSVAVPEGDD